MPSWTGYSCAKCKKRIVWEGENPYYSIGVPYLSCGNCGAINDRSYRRNEWDLMKWPKKIPVYVTTALGGLFLGTGAGALVSSLAKEKLGLQFLGSDAIWMVSGAVIGVLVFWRWQQKAILESRNRLADESYRKTLLTLGIATGSLVALKGSPRERIFPAPRRMAVVTLWCVIVMAVFVSFALAIEHFFPAG